VKGSPIPALQKGESKNDDRTEAEKAADFGEEVLLPFCRSRLEDLESLEPPSSDQARIATMLDVLARAPCTSSSTG